MIITRKCSKIVHVVDKVYGYKRTINKVVSILKDKITEMEIYQKSSEYVYAISEFVIINKYNNTIERIFTVYNIKDFLSKYDVQSIHNQDLVRKHKLQSSFVDNLINRR